MLGIGCSSGQIEFENCCYSRTMVMAKRRAAARGGGRGVVEVVSSSWCAGQRWFERYEEVEEDERLLAHARRTRGSGGATTDAVTGDKLSLRARHP